MTFALSTNWNNGRLEDGAAIADEALELGFDSLELGFRTTPEQLDGMRSGYCVMENGIGFSLARVQMPGIMPIQLASVASKSWT